MPLRGGYTEQTDLGVTEASFTDNPLQYVREAYTRFLQGVFSVRESGDYRWLPDEKYTEIHIVNENPISPRTFNDRPIITLTRGEVAFQTLGFDDMVSYDFRTGTKRKSVLIPGMMVANVCAKFDQESENLAMFVASRLWVLRDAMQRMGFFHIGQNIRVGAPSPPGSIMPRDEGQLWYCSRVFSPFQFVHTSQVTPVNQDIFRHIQGSFSTSEAPESAPMEPHPLDPSKAVVVFRTRPQTQGSVRKGRSFRF